MGISAFSTVSASTLAAIGSAMPRWGSFSRNPASTRASSHGSPQPLAPLTSSSVVNTHGPSIPVSPYCQAIPSLRASHPLAGSAPRGRGRRHLSLTKASPLPASDAAPATVSRLRVLREFEPGAHPATAGRMVISGRMVDVCAELDRMVSAESGH